MITIKHPGSRWRKSSYSDRESNCVEVTGQSGAVAVRDTKNLQGPALAFTPGSWQAFTRAIKDGPAAR